MFFRNLTMFRFPAAVVALFSAQPIEEGASFEMRPPVLEEGLAACQLRPVGPLELSTRGFVSPFGRDSEALGHRIGNTILITVGGENRLLPGAVVNEALSRKLAEIEQAEGARPGGRTRKRIKDELVTEMLPRAFVRPSRVDAIIDLDLGVIAVDTSSRKAAEMVVSEVRRALGSFPALPLNPEIAPRTVLTGWVAGGEMPEGLVIGEECELRDPTDHGAVVKVQRMDLHAEEIARHLEAGKQVTRLALTYQDHMSFVLGEDLVVRKFKLLDGAIDTLEDADADDVRAELDARFALMSGEFKRLFPVLESSLRLSTVEG